mgnify:CR=1 FL=1
MRFYIQSKGWYDHGVETLCWDGTYDIDFNEERILFFQAREEATARLEKEREKYPNANCDWAIEECEE